MKYFIFISCLFFTTAYAESKLEKTIFVTGSCTEQIIPDRVSVSISVEELHKKQKISTERANKKYNQILKSAKDLSLKDAEFVTTGYNVYPHKPWENRKQVFKGYKTKITLKISTSEIDKTSKLLSVGNDIGQDFVTGPNPYVSEALYQKTYRNCLAKAMKDAKAKAKIIAKSSKRKLGKVLAVSEGQRNSDMPRPMYKAARMEMMADSQGASPNIEFGKNKVKVHLSVFFDLD